MSLVSFGSDNHAPVHPLLMDAMLEVNKGFAASYGKDPISQNLKKKICDMFEATDAALVFNGTAANVICMQLGLESYEAVLCADTSHLILDECGAPEKIAGIKLIALPSLNGKIKIDEIEKAIVRKGDQHHSQIRMISITQPTEYGTVYSRDEIKRIKEICEAHKLYLHMDGARLANAAAHFACGLGDLTQSCDLISFGGAKNALMLGEFVIVRNPKLARGLKYYRKQSLQLPAKARYLSAPFLKYLENNLWLEIASHENAMAQKLRGGIEDIPGVQVTQPTQSNAVFCRLPQPIIKSLKKQFFFYVWDENSFEVRLMTSFTTTKEDVDQFLDSLNQLLQAKDKP